jgi:chromosome segregation ATPase
MTPANIDALIARLTPHDAAMQRLATALSNAADDLAVATERLAAHEAERATVVEKQAGLEKEIAEAPALDTFTTARERDTERERQRQLRLSLERLAQGALAYAPGRLYRPLAYLDQRIAEVRERRDRVQAALDACLRQAEALLAEQPVASS